ncbi:xylulokinase [Variovorax sp. CY25R-8]|uniref:xylulokinase n=1 Tax=Variovorax sp. CY25R-8 TaxID=2855501 RepID=UPI0021BAB214|nr:xylulokinase [Variovorax sp. CY25R-8]MCT8180178.1 xylulokinase [Variovorax sp. CY25R-8]
MSTNVSLGIDLGTSAVKVLLLDEDGTVLGHVDKRLPISRPQPDWSEQHPRQWWAAVREALADLRNACPRAWPRIACIGLTGQMHGAVVLDRDDQPIRPAMLHNDGRAVKESREIEAAVPQVAAIAGSRPMAGLTAPKLRWMARHEPERFAAIDCVLSPKDYLRLRLTGERATDVSDAAGTLWFDVKRRCWSEPLVAASGLALSQLPRVRESIEPGATLLPQVAAELGLAAGVVVAAGGGDTPVSGLGIGSIELGEAFVNLSTSASIVAVTGHAAIDEAASIHAWCHALPGRWYQMGAMLSGASCLRWISRIVGEPDEDALLRVIEGNMARGGHPAQALHPAQAPLFLPYLSGERTPHNDVDARGVFFGLSHDTNAALLGHSVLEGVCFGLRDAMAAIESTGTRIASLAVVGGGARSIYWTEMLASVLGKPVHRLAGGELGAALGAARLGWLALGHDPRAVCRPARVVSRHQPDEALASMFDTRYRSFRDMYRALAPLFGARAQALSPRFMESVQ